MNKSNFNCITSNPGKYSINIFPGKMYVKPYITKKDCDCNFHKKSSYINNKKDTKYKSILDNMREAFSTVFIKEKSDTDEEYNAHVKQFFDTFFTLNSFSNSVTEIYEKVVLQSKYTYHEGYVLYDSKNDKVIEFYEAMLKSKDTFSHNPAIRKYIGKAYAYYVGKLATLETQEEKNCFYTININEPFIYNIYNYIVFAAKELFPPVIIRNFFIYIWTGERKKLYEAEREVEIKKERIEEINAKKKGSKKKVMEAELQVSMEHIRQMYITFLNYRIMIPLVTNFISNKLNKSNKEIFISNGTEYFHLNEKIRDDPIIMIYDEMLSCITSNMYSMIRKDSYFKKYTDEYNINLTINLFRKIDKHVSVKYKQIKNANKVTLELFRRNGYPIDLMTEKLGRNVRTKIAYMCDFSKYTIGFINKMTKDEFIYFLSKQMKIRTTKLNISDGNDDDNQTSHIDENIRKNLLKKDDGDLVALLNDIPEINKLILRKFNLNAKRVYGIINKLDETEKIEFNNISKSFALFIYSRLSGETSLVHALTYKNLLFMNVCVALYAHKLGYKHLPNVLFSTFNARTKNNENVLSKILNIYFDNIEKNKSISNKFETIGRNEAIQEIKETINKNIISLYDFESNTVRKRNIGDLYSVKDNITEFTLEYLLFRYTLLHLVDVVIPKEDMATVLPI